MRTLLIGVLAGLTVIVVHVQAADPRSGFVLVANQQSASASLIDLTTDTARIIAVGDGPHEAVIAPSGRTAVVTVYGIAGAPGNQVAVVDIDKGVVTKTISLGELTRPHGAMFLPGDERRIAVTSETTQNVVLVDLLEGKVEAVIPTKAAGSHMVAITADGRRAFTSNVGGGSVSELDLARRAFVREIPIAPRVEGIAVSPDGTTVWAGSNTEGTVSVIDTASGTIAATLRGFSMPYRMAFSSDGKTVAICDASGDKLHIADALARKVVWTLDGLGAPRGVNIAPDGKTAFVTLAGDETMGVVDLETHRLTRRIKVQRSPDGVWFGLRPR